MRDLLTPCVSVCDYDWEIEVCVGCGRTIQEITDWMSYTTEQKQNIINKINDNRKQLQQSDHTIIS